MRIKAPENRKPKREDPCEQDNFLKGKQKAKGQEEKRKALLPAEFFLGEGEAKTKKLKPEGELISLLESK